MLNRRFEILHDDGRQICIVGNTYVNHLVHDTVARERSCVIMTFEECQVQPDSFFEDHQFFSTSSDMPFKIKVVRWLKSKNVSFISPIDSTSVIDEGVKIGRNTVIMNHNSIFHTCEVGNHCHMVNYVTVVHRSSLGDFCYVCGYSYLCYTTLGTGVVVGLRSSFVPRLPLNLEIPDYTNFLLNSSVNKPIASAGTYFGNRLISQETSLTHQVF